MPSFVEHNVFDDNGVKHYATEFTVTISQTSGTTMGDFDVLGCTISYHCLI